MKNIPYPRKKSRIIILLFVGLIIYFLMGGWSSIRYSIINTMWLKNAAQNGVDPKLLYPFGTCDNHSIDLKSLEQNIPLPASPYLQGVAALRTGNLSKAEQYFQAALNMGLVSNASQYALGVVDYLLGKDPTPHWQESNHIMHMLAVGRACDISNNKDVASKYYRYVLQNPESLNHYSRRKVYQELLEFFATTDDENSFSQSLLAYEAIADPTSLDYYWTLATSWRDHGQPSRALAYYKVVLERTPNDSLAWWNAGRAYEALKDFDTARDYYLKAYQLDPKNINFYIYIGNTYLAQKQYASAGEWFEKAIAIDADCIWALSNLVIVRQAQNRNEEAMAIIDHVLELAPDAYLRALASDVAINMQNWQLAKAFISEALALEPKNPEYLRKMAFICENLIDHQCAKQAYIEILKLEPNDREIQERLQKLSE